jgi:predicted alpha/beta hydrolase family esterase
VRQRLPFASLAVIGADDPFCTPQRAHGMAADWGSRTLDAGPKGHLNADSGMGDWPEGRVLLAQLLRN